MMKLFLILLIINSYKEISAQFSNCGNKPCQNGATCINQPELTYGYTCICAQGYYGTNCQYSTKDKNKPIIGGASGTVDVNPKPNSDTRGNSNSGSGGGGGGSININPGGGGGVSIKGNDINIGGGSGSGSGFGANRDPTCLNGGVRPMAGLPCTCRTGFYGLRCEYSGSSGGSGSGNNWPYNNIQGYCSSYPCQNGGRCMPTATGYYCECRYNFYGSRCEYSSSRGNYNYRMTGIFGSLMPLLLFCCLISLCLYCCCAKKRYMNGTNFMGRDLFGTFGGFGRRPNNSPFPGPGAPVGGGGGYYAPPPPGPAAGFPMHTTTGVYTMQTRQQTVPLMMQDPDEAFKVNMSPPPYEEIVQKTNR